MSAWVVVPRVERLAEPVLRVVRVVVAWILREERAQCGIA
jgi:hypothetical protein